MERAEACLAVVTDSVVLVAVSVAAVVRGAEAKPGRVVWVLRDGEILRVETEIVSTASPARQSTVLVSLTVSLALSTGLAGRTSPLTAVVTRVPPSSALEVAVILPADTDTLAVLVSVAVPGPLTTGLVRPAAVLPSPAHSAQGVGSNNLHHHTHLTPVTAVRQGVLQEGEAGQLALERLIVVTVGVTLPTTGLDVVQALVGTANIGPRL